MKRKLSALLSLMLAVVMVFPTAVFADGEGEGTPPTVGTFDVTVDGRALSSTTYEVPVGKNIVIAASVDTGVTVTHEVSDHEAVGKGTASGKTFTFTGQYPNETTTVTLTAKKTIPAAEEGGTPTEVTENKTVSIKCVVPTVDTTKTKVTYTGHNAGDIHSLAPGAEVKDAKLDITLDNGTTFSGATAISAKVNTANDFSDPTKSYSSVTVKSGDNKLYFQYTISKAYGNYTYETTGVYEHTIYVLGKTIDKIEISGTNRNNYRLTETLADLKNTEDLIVTAKYADGKSENLNDYNILGLYSVDKSGDADDAIAKAKNTPSQSAANFSDCLTNEEIYIVVEYDGSYGAALVSDVLSFSNPVASKVEVITVGASNNSLYEVIDGQILGEETYDDVVICITYQDGTADYFMNDNGGNYQGSDVPGIRSIPGTLTFSPFDYGTDGVSFSYKANNSSKKIVGSLSCSDLFIKVQKKEVEKLEIANKTGVKLTYEEGEKLDLKGLTLNVYYNNGSEPVEISYSDPNCKCSPNDRDALTSDIDTVLFVYTYTDPDGKNQSVECELPITVKKATTSTSSIKEVTLISTTEAKIDYFIGESFDPDGFMILVIYNGDKSSEIIDLGDCSSVTVTKPVTKYSGGKFIEKMDEGTLTVTFNLPTSITNLASERGRTITIDGISATKRPVLESVTVSSAKDVYMEGDAPRVVDFKYIAKYDDGTTRVFEPDKDDEKTEKTTYTKTIDTVTYTIKLTPTSIDADTKNIRVSYAEKVSGQTTKTVYVDYPIEEVIVPDAILRYYDTSDRTYVTKAYDDFYDALEEAEEIMDSYTSAYSSRIPEVQIRKDITMLSDFTTTESFDIEMNGHTLTMIRGDITVSSRAASGTEINFINSDKTDARLVYSDSDDDTIIIAQNDHYTIDKDTAGAGKYDIVISTVKNGKVTGPDEVTHGHDAQFTITPDEGYQLSTIKVNNKTVSLPKDGEKLTVSDIQAKTTITVTFAEKAWDCPFTDVYKSANYYKSIQFVYENELFNGTSATKFEPETTMTRAMFVTVLGRLAEVNVNNYSGISFTDVKESAATSWYVPYVEWASSIGLVEGYGNGKFGPDDPITHAQMYVLMQRYALIIEKLSTSAAGTSIPANDVKDIPDWAEDAVRYAAKKDFLVTSSNRLTPNANAKRSELAMLLDKFCVNVLDWEE